MGLCGNKQPEPPEPEPDEEKKYKKLLLLGAGWSGKSTVFKQMKVHYGKGFTKEERLSLRWTIYQNIYQAMKTLCEENKNEKYGKNDPKILKDLEAVRTYEDNGDTVVLDTVLGNQIKRLWDSESIRETYKHRTEFFFANDEVHYFFKNIEDIMKTEYIPTEEDVLRCRWISTGVKREIFDIDSIPCELLDVGGQRSERKKWVKCFQNVYIVLFVVAISEYDQVMYEDEDENRVTDALNLFEDICNSKWFCDTNVVLFLNKIDLFNEKVKDVPLKTYFPAFDPKETKENPEALAKEARDYLKYEFEARNHQERPVIVKVTSATESADIRVVFDETIKSIVKKNNS